MNILRSSKMAKQVPVVGNIVERKGVKYEITGINEDRVLLKDISTDEGKTKGLKFDSPVYEEMFLPIGTKSTPKEEKKQEVKAPKDASEKVDMSKYVEGESPEDTQPAEVKPKVEKKQEVKAPKEEKPKAEKKAKKKEPVEEETDLLEIDWEDTENHTINTLANMDTEIGALAATLADPETTAIAQAYSVAWIHRASLGFDYDEVTDLIFNQGVKEGRKFKTIHDVDYNALNEYLTSLEGKKKFTSADSFELIKHIPLDETDAKIMCQLLLDGCLTAYGYSLKACGKDANIISLLAYMTDISFEEEAE